MSSRPILVALTELVRAKYDTMACIQHLLDNYPLDLQEARTLVEWYRHEVENAIEIAHSKKWIADRVAEARYATSPNIPARMPHRLPIPTDLEDRIDRLLDTPTSGHTSWEPTGIVERISVIADTYEIPDHVASILVGYRIRVRKTAPPY